MLTVATRRVISTELAEYGVIHSSFCATVLVPLLTLPMYTQMCLTYQDEGVTVGGLT